jgi:hypothetical protein
MRRASRTKIRRCARLAGQAFYNTSAFTLRDLRSRASQQQLRADFEAYLDGSLPNVQEIIDNSSFATRSHVYPRRRARHVNREISRSVRSI